MYGRVPCCRSSLLTHLDLRSVIAALISRGKELKENVRVYFGLLCMGSGYWCYNKVV